MFNPEKEIDRLRSESHYVNTEQLIDLEQELVEAKEASGMASKRNALFRFIDKKIADYKPKTVSKKKYIALLWSCGWLCGAHRFYAGKKITGLLYLLFCWTGIPFAMCIIDWMQVVPVQADENGAITI